MLFRFLILAFLLFPNAISWADSLSDWMLLEQTRINRTVDEARIIPPDIKNQSQKYRPESQSWYPLKAVWVPAEELNVAIDQGEFDPKISNLFVRVKEGKTEYRLLVHPESEKFYKTFLTKYPVDSSTFRATSTASSRTVLVQANGNKGPSFFAKLSLDVELGGVRRTVPQGEVARSVGTSMYLKELENRIGADRFTHMAEPFGISPKGWERGGMILRQVPESLQKGETKLVPLFSLYSVDKNGRSLLQDLADKAKVTPEDFVKRHILNPFYNGWVRWNLEGGVAMEAHAQNVLLELDSKNNPTGRFVHRDLGGFSIDLRSPQAKNQPTLPIFTDRKNDYHQAFVDKARRQSLYTYFDGGFLYNVDKELARIQPGYKSGDVFKDGRKILSSIFTYQSGVAPIPSTSLSTGEGVESALKKAQLAYRNRKPLTQNGSCKSSFRALMHP